MNINDIGLKLLSFIKKLKGNEVDIGKINQSNSPTMTHTIWNELLHKYVADNGNVNYKGFQSEQNVLQNYLDDLTRHAPSRNWPIPEKLAYWINAYNAFTVKLIIDHYPLESIKDISKGLPMIDSPWDIKFFKIGEVDFDLNTIEHEILRKKFEEPRIHFAINCASVSCPKLRNEAFTAADLEVQLNEQATSFMNDGEKNIINSNETKLSRIFKWFETDFTKEVSIVDYIKKYNAVIDSNNKIEFLEYNWNLNE